MSSKYSCSYATLGEYAGTGNEAADQATGIPSMKIQTIPVYGGIGYEALTHDGKCSCGGHFQLMDAYPDAENNTCPKYAQRACGGNLQ